MKYLLPLFLFLSFVSCKYSFRGISIPPGVKTYYVNFIENESPNVVATLSQDFTTILRTKVREESPLLETQVDPDAEFKGVITSYRVSEQAPTSDVAVAYNRINMTVSMEYINNLDPEAEPKKRSFDIYRDFDSSTNLLDVQDALIEEINTELVEKIFQWAFTSW